MSQNIQQTGSFDIFVRETDLEMKKVFPRRD